MNSRTYKYDVLAEVKLKDVMSCRHNRALLHRIKNNDPGLTSLTIVRDGMVNGEGGYDDEDFKEVNKHSGSLSMAGKIKVLRGFPDLNMTPLLQWDLKLFPLAKTWFQHITNTDEGWGDLTANIRSRELSVIYSFVKGMPVWVADDCKKYLAEQLQRFGATKRRLQEEIQEVEERERRLVEGW